MSELTEQQKEIIRKFMERPEPYPSACACMGPQRGDPLCPCAMAWVVEYDSRLYRIFKEKQEFGYAYLPEDIGAVEGPFINLGEEQTEFSVFLTDAGDSRIYVIKEIRQYRTDIGLADAKALTEKLPKIVKRDISLHEAKEIAQKLEAAGGTVEIK